MSTALSILKFGGTSLGDGERIRAVAQIVASTFNDPEEGYPVVVVSAMAKVTDQLLRVALFVCEGKHEDVQRELRDLKQRHYGATEQAVENDERRSALVRDLEEAFGKLEEDVARLQEVCNHGMGELRGDEGRGLMYRARGVGVIQELEQVSEAGAIHQAPTGVDNSINTAVRDITLPLAITAVAAWGERLSVLVVAAAVDDIGIAAVAVREGVIITEYPAAHVPSIFGSVVGAEPLPEETRRHVRSLLFPLIEQGSVPIVAGFIGHTMDGAVTTLGRNGSDYSATVIGATLDCAQVSIYTDVDGVLTADPRLVMNTRLLPQLSYAEAARLAWFGAKVLHPRTLIPVASRNIPVRVRNSFRPHLRGTLIGPDITAQHSGAAAITIRRHLALITMESTDLFGAPETASQVFTLAARAGAAPVAICSSAGHHLSFVVEEAAAEAAVALLQQDMGSWRVHARSGLAVCACIGSGFAVDPVSPARAIMALAREHIPVITQGASELGITLIVEDGDSERTLRALHRDLIAPVIPLMRYTNTVDVQERKHGVSRY